MPKLNNIELSKPIIHGAIEFAKDKDIEIRDIRALERIAYHSNILEGKKLAKILGSEIFIKLNDQENDADYKLVFQEILKKFIFSTKPSYLYSLIHGLAEFKKSLNEDEYQCFSDAGLLEELNLKNESICRWWDEVERLSWEESKSDNLDTGRIGEKKTLKFEENRLIKLGVKKKPYWEARNSNRSGYDILSYDKNNKEIFEIYLESKSTVNQNGYFYLTKGEWRKAEEKKDKFYIYHWHVKSESPRIISYDELRKHIPKNRGKGIWNDIIIKITPLK